MLLKQLINTGTETILPLYPESEAREMVLAFLQHLLGTKRHTHIVEPEYEVSAEAASVALAAFDRMAYGEPIQYITGIADFYGRHFKVSPSVLIPRPETEILCRTAVEISRHFNNLFAESVLHPVQRILDICTGSGCIAWTMALECPESEVIAVDISDEALTVAASQDFRAQMENTKVKAPSFIKADVLEKIPSCSCMKPGFDIILSNPPYVMDKEKAMMRSNVLDHEPHLALFVSDEDPLLFYRAIASWAERLLAPHGKGIVEINEALGKETAQVFKDAGFTHAEVLKDLSERDRFILFSY